MGRLLVMACSIFSGLDLVMISDKSRANGTLLTQQKLFGAYACDLQPGIIRRCTKC